MKVPVCEPSIGKQEALNVADAVSSGWIAGYKGKYIDEFEQRFADYCGYKYGISTTSCATAMLLTLEALGISKGDEVITTSFTHIATISAIIHAGATPVLVDVDPETWTMDTDEVEARVTAKTKAIMPVNMYGHPVNMKDIGAIAERSGLLIIEDAAEGIGSRSQGVLPDAACFSFYINKMITCGEGGMIVTNSKDLADMARRLKGYDTDAGSRFVHQRLGFNYRMTNIQAAIGCAQMDRIDEFVDKKQWIANQYREKLGTLDWLQMPVERDWARNSYWVFGILVRPEARISRDELVKKLKDAGIETRNFFVPMNKQPALRRLGLFTEEEFPVAEDINRRGLYLPNGTMLTRQQIDYVCNRVEEAGKC